MNSIKLRSDLHEALEQDAEQEARSINELVNEAVEQYQSTEQTYPEAKRTQANFRDIGIIRDFLQIKGANQTSSTTQRLAK